MAPQQKEVWVSLSDENRPRTPGPEKLADPARRCLRMAVCVCVGGVLRGRGVSRVGRECLEGPQGAGSHLSQPEHRKMRKATSKQVATAARLPHRTICACPPASALPEGPMAGAGGGTAGRQSCRAGGMGAGAASSCEETNLPETPRPVPACPGILSGGRLCGRAGTLRAPPDL